MSYIAVPTTVSHIITVSYKQHNNYTTYYDSAIFCTEKRLTMNRNKNSIFWGLMLIAIACYLILSQLQIVTLAVSITKLILGVIFVGTAINSIVEKSFGGFFCSLAFLWIIFDSVFKLPVVSTPVVLMIALLLTIGFSMLFPKKHRVFANYDEKKHVEWDDYDNPDKVGKHQTVFNSDTNETFYGSNRFGASAKYINTGNFQKADIDCSFGEIKVYFDSAKITGSSAEICVRQSFGCTQLFIPKEWQIVQKASAFAGAIEERNQNKSTGSPIVYLTGEVKFGSIIITYV